MLKNNPYLRDYLSGHVDGFFEISGNLLYLDNPLFQGRIDNFLYFVSNEFIILISK